MSNSRKASQTRKKSSSKKAAQSPNSKTAKKPPVGNDGGNDGGNEQETNLEDGPEEHLKNLQESFNLHYAKKCELLHLEYFASSTAIGEVKRIDDHIFLRRLPGAILYTVHTFNEDRICAAVNSHTVNISEFRGDVQNAIQTVTAELERIQSGIEAMKALIDDQEGSE